MFHQQHAHALRTQFAKQRGERALLGDAQAGGGLVEQQQPRIERERACDLDETHLAERERARRFVRMFGQTDARNLSARFGEKLGLFVAIQPRDRAQGTGMTAQMAAERNVLDDAHIRQQLHMLEGAADADLRGLARGRVAAQRAAKQQVAVIARQQAGQKVESRALACAIRADEREDLAGLDLEADVVDRDQAAEAPCHAAGFDQRLAFRCRFARGQGAMRRV